MANQKITDYSALAGASVTTSTDLLEIVDFDVLTNKKITVDALRIALLSNTALTNSLSGDVALNNTASVFVGPTVSQGTTGTWFATGTVTITDTSGPANFLAILTDGTTVFASAATQNRLANSPVTISLSGFIASPAGNIRISVQDTTSTSGTILFNSTGNSKDSTITAVRIG